MKIAAIFADQESLGGKEVTVCGWARTIRDMKTFGFIELNDGSCFKNLQVVMSAEELANYKEIAAQNVGAALIVHGTVVLTPDAKQPLELKAHTIEVEGKSTPDYPLQKKRHSVEFLRTIQHLRPRTNLFSATFRVRSVAAMAVHEFFQSNGFVYVQTPIITGSDCEGAGEMFQVTTLDLNNVPKTEDGQVDYSQDFFGKKTSLTVSGQLNAENFAMAFGDVYTFGPTFRAENSNTTRHAAEFWMIEPEMAFADLNDYMKPAVRMAALMEQPVKFIWTHDAFRVGEDGPTHEPVEQEAQIRLMEKLKNHKGHNSMLVLRPADAEETTIAWKLAMENMSTPTGLIFSRQNIANLPAGTDYEQAAKGAYIVAGSDENPDVILVASGSEVATLVAGTELLRKDGVKVRIVSAPSEGLFRNQPKEYQEAILPADAKIFGMTAGLPVTLQGLVGCHGKVWGLESFGFSAPYKVLDEKLGFTAENVYNQVKAML